MSKWNLYSFIQNKIQRVRLYWRLLILNFKVARYSSPDSDDNPVVFFNASARLEGLNLNAAFGMISSWALQLRGKKILHVGCHSAMKQCVLGAVVAGPESLPPCKGCIQDTRWFTAAAPTIWFDYQDNPKLRSKISEIKLDNLSEFVYRGMPLGSLILPSLRWVLRRFHLHPDQQTHYLVRSFLLSAAGIADQMEDLISKHQPETVVVFNGLQYPEAVVRWKAQQHNIRVITYESNLMPFSAFFTDQQATIYPMEIPDDFELSAEQNQKLDSYLSKRFQGDFTMAGIQFWPGMQDLPREFLNRVKSFQGVVPIFTNVIFDTSQVHANTLFEDMFSWLDDVLSFVRENPEILFVIRAHPDEIRPGKSSQESVAKWIEDQKVENLLNLVFIPAEETLSSYELIKLSKFVMVYNSSIGLEASLLGVPVLCAGKARYTQYPTVHYPESKQQYRKTLDEFIDSEHLPDQKSYQMQARRFLFWQLFRASLPFSDFLKEHQTPGYVQLKAFSWKNLLRGKSVSLDVIEDGILQQKQFVLPDEDL